MNSLIVSLLLKIFIATIILYAGWKVAKFLRNTIVTVLGRKNVDAMLVSFTANVAYIGILLFAVVAALGQLGVQTTSIIAVIGAAGLAIGLSLQ
ncbi:MAG: mechanosensitive ion channel family protein, partial [Gammaproteobacteria bacterium]